MVDGMSRAAWFGLLCAVSGAVGAENLPDPTRPPAVLEAPGAVVDKPSNGLQSVLISGNHRAAIIDGETVELGRKHGDAKLIEVNEGNVVLQGTQGRQVLSLFPGVKITKRDSSMVDAPLPKVKQRSTKRKAKQVAPEEKK